MSRVPVGKVLLRNVIRHTDAHNKIQEESEMWKQRNMELKSSSPNDSKRRWTVSDRLAKSSMHCDRYLDGSAASVRDRLDEREYSSERDERETRYWTRKLYEFEANDPDRWGHSGFKELYPEEFQSDSERGCMKHSRKNAKEKRDSDRQKNSKKSSKRKKNKKRKKKKQKEAGSDSDSDGSEEDCVQKKKKRKDSKSKHGRKKTRKSKERDDGSMVEDSDSNRGGKIPHRKRHRHRTGEEARAEPERKRRKNWKSANEEKSEDSSDD